ncbi:MAG TPA: hypothetical protein VHT25_05400 [Solirubrobacteraceae bacterium]|nr:hypothetical protein [Solirubrobacteraceae bacterium]
MSHRPLATVTGLTIGDYLLWNWSLNANHDVLALVSGLTLPPLTIACVWLLVLTAARLIARRSRDRGHTRAQHATAKRASSGALAEQPQPQARTSAPAAPAARSRKIAA